MDTHSSRTLKEFLMQWKKLNIEIYRSYNLTFQGIFDHPVWICLWFYQRNQRTRNISNCDLNSSLRITPANLTSVIFPPAIITIIAIATYNRMKGNNWPCEKDQSRVVSRELSPMSEFNLLRRRRRWCVDILSTSTSFD